MTASRKQIIFDIDDTLIPWEVPNSLAYPAMSQAMADYSGLEHENIVRDIKLINSKHGSIEYSALVQEMPCFAHLTEANKVILIEIAYQAKKLALQKNQPFKNITILLETLQTNNLIMKALSDAPIVLAHRRLAQTGLIKYFEEIIARPSPANELFPQKFRRHLPPKPKTTVTETGKPHVDLQQVLNMSEQEISENVIIIGNSSVCDEGVARLNGTIYFKTRWDKGTEEHKKIIREYAPEDHLPSNAKQAPNPSALQTKEGFQMYEAHSPIGVAIALRAMGIIQNIIVPESE